MQVGRKPILPRLSLVHIAIERRETGGLSLSEHAYHILDQRLGSLRRTTVIL